MSDRSGWFRRESNSLPTRRRGKKYTAPPAFLPEVRSPLVEAGGQCIRRFRGGLDYAFIRAVSGADAERLIPLCQRNPSTHPGRIIHGEPMSLYGAGLKLALFLPLGVAMPLSEESAVRFHRCELRYQPTLTDRRDP